MGRTKRKNVDGENKRVSGKDRLISILMYFVVGIAVTVLIVCLAQVVPKFLEYQQSDSTYSQMADMSITKYQVDDTIEENDSVSDVKDALQIDWDAFQGTEIVAWFQMDGLSYPIMQHSDNSYYLNHLPDGSYNSGGSLFLLNHNNPLLTDQSSFIYGHNMNNGSMFGSLKRYTTEDSKDHIFYLYLPDGTRHAYQFFSVATVFQESRAYTWSFESDDTFVAWQEWMLSQSRVSTSLSPSKEAKFVTLSTCNGYSGTNHRLVVCGQEVRVDQLQQPASWYEDYMSKYNQKNEEKVKRAADILNQLQTLQQTHVNDIHQEYHGQ